MGAVKVHVFHPPIVAELHLNHSFEPPPVRANMVARLIGADAAARIANDLIARVVTRAAAKNLDHLLFGHAHLDQASTFFIDHRYGLRELPDKDAADGREEEESDHD